MLSDLPSVWTCGHDEFVTPVHVPPESPDKRNYFENVYTDVPECAVCLQSCNHPTQLPCGHIFCFLCAKGVAIQNRRCAMCRQEIPSDYLDNPILIEEVNSNTPADTEERTEAFQWYYEGRNGWWKYDERSNETLEERFTASATNCELLVAGHLYLVDFQHMIQYRRNDSTRRRKIKRDTPTVPAKGIAGIKIPSLDKERVKSPDPYEQNDDPALMESGTFTGDTEADADEQEPIIPPPHPFSLIHAMSSLNLNTPEAEAGNQDSNSVQTD